MARQIRLEEISQGGGSREVAVLHEKATPLGREPENGIKIEHPAVSRTHGMMIPVRNHWIFRDMGSTNGSWVNGNPVLAGRSKIVRPGDTIQLADVFLRVSPTSADPDKPDSLHPKSPRSLLVFRGEEFVDEYPVPEFGKALVIGGTGADLQLAGLMKDRPSLVVETRGDRLCAYRIDKELPASLNGADLNESLFLKDGDEVSIGEYLILFSDGTSPQLGMGLTQGEVLTPKVRDWGDEPSGLRNAPSYRPSGGTVFGAKPDEDENEALKTVSISSEDLDTRIQSYNRPSMKFDDDYVNPYDEGMSLEQKLYIFIGVTLLTTVLLLVFWWLG